MSFYLGGTEITSQPYFGSSSISKIYKGTTTVWEYLPTDPYFDDVTLLLHMDGADGSTTFIDDSNNSWTMTTNNAINISTAQYKFGGASCETTATNETVVTPSDSTFALGTDDFTVECWYRPTSRPGLYPIIMRFGVQAWGDNDVFRLNDRHEENNTKFSVDVYAFTSATNYLVSTTSVVDGTWYHLAVTRSGNTFRFFVNGVQEDSATNTGAVSSSASIPFRVGGAVGFTDDVRITRGVARYTSNFTPPTAAFPNSGPNPTDPNFSDVGLLLHGDGTNGSTTITDDSASAKTVTASGNAVISTTQSKFGGSSLYFPGATTDFMSTPNSTDWAFGTGDFTVEAWIYIDGNTPQNAGGTRTATICNTWTSAANIIGWIFSVGGDATTTGTQLRIDSWDGAGNSTRFYANVTIAQQTWHHVAATVESGTRRLFLNGTLLSGTTDVLGSGYTTFLANTLNIGVTPNSGYPLPLNGYIDDLRITKGVARYTAAFTPPTAAFPNSGPDPNFSNVSLLLHMDGTNGSTTFTDNSNNGFTVTANGNAQVSTAQSKFGGASALFDGNGDYLTIPNSAEFAFGSGDFTVEGWVRTTDADAVVVSHATNGGATNTNWGVYFISGVFSFYASDGSTYQISALGANSNVNDGAWHHFAVTRSGNDFKLFVDGVQSGSTGVWAGTISSTSRLLRIGDNGNSSTATWLNGYIDELRITKGVARYTSNFTPPTAAFPNS